MTYRQNQAMVWADSVSDITKGLGNLSSEMREDDKYRRERQSKDNINANVTAMQQAGDNYGNAQLKGTATDQAEARRIYGMDLQNIHAIDMTRRDNRVNAMVSGMLYGLSTQGVAFEPNLKGLDTSEAYEAMNKAYNMFSQSQQGKELIFKNRLASIERGYAQLEQYNRSFDEAESQGNTVAMANILERAYMDYSSPHSIKWNNQTGSFDHLYKPRETGEWTPVGSVSMQEAREKLKSMTYEKYGNEKMLAMELTKRENSAALLPVGAKDENGLSGMTQIFKKDGQAYSITPQRNIEKPVVVDYIVRSHSDNSTQVFHSRQELAEAGFMYEDLKREKAQKDLVLADQKIISEHARQGQIAASTRASNSRANYYDKGGAGQKKGQNILNTKRARDMQKQLIEEASKFFGSGNGELSIDANGNLTQAGENTRDAAMKFFYEKQADAAAGNLSPQERQKFFIAQSLVGGVKQFFGVPDLPADQQPPVPGAKRAADGKWYVQRNGQWGVLEKDDTMKSSHLPNTNLGSGPQSAMRGY